MFKQMSQTKIIRTNYGFHYNIGVQKEKADRKLVSICLKYVILEYFTLTVLLRRSAGSERFRAGEGI